MLALPIIQFLIFYVYLNFDSILMAFRLPQDGGGYEWTLINFKQLFTDFTVEGSEIGEALVNTLIFFAASVLVTFPLSYLMCYFLYKKIPGYKIFRVIFFLPSIISASVLAVLFRYIVSINGPVAEFVGLFGTEWKPVLQTPDGVALWTIVVYVVIFGLGGNLILFSGAMNNVDKGVIEAAEIDGAGMWTELIRIIVPMTWPTISTVLTFCFVGLFNATGPILVLTHGLYNTNTIAYWIYSKVAFSNELYYPAAVGLFFTVIGAPIALFMRWLLAKRVDDIVM